MSALHQLSVWCVPIELSRLHLIQGQIKLVDTFEELFEYPLKWKGNGTIWIVDCVKWLCWQEVLSLFIFKMCQLCIFWHQAMLNNKVASVCINANCHCERTALERAINSICNKRKSRIITWSYFAIEYTFHAVAAYHVLLPYAEHVRLYFSIFVVTQMELDSNVCFSLMFYLQVRIQVHFIEL